MQVNKPYLPLASGEFSMRTAAAVVVATGAAALALGAAAASAPLMATLAGSLALGVAYSTDLPGLRWKQHPLAAAACILAVRCARTMPHAHALRKLCHAWLLLCLPISCCWFWGMCYCASITLAWFTGPSTKKEAGWYQAAVISTSSGSDCTALCGARAVMVQLGFYAHMKLALGAPRAGLAPSGPLLFAVAFMLVFSAVIALFKDIPDVKGDRQARPAMCVVKSMRRRCTLLLSSAYFGCFASRQASFLLRACTLRGLHQQIA